MHHLKCSFHYNWNILNNTKPSSGVYIYSETHRVESPAPPGKTAKKDELKLYDWLGVSQAWRRQSLKHFQPVLSFWKGLYEIFFWHKRGRGDPGPLLYLVLLCDCSFSLLWGFIIQCITSKNPTHFWFTNDRYTKPEKGTVNSHPYLFLLALFFSCTESGWCRVKGSAVLQAIW